jgi:hypothetical protein
MLLGGALVKANLLFWGRRLLVGGGKRCSYTERLTSKIDFFRNALTGLFPKGHYLSRLKPGLRFLGPSGRLSSIGPSGVRTYKNWANA